MYVIDWRAFERVALSLGQFTRTSSKDRKTDGSTLTLVMVPQRSTKSTRALADRSKVEHIRVHAGEPCLPIAYMYHISMQEIFRSNQHMLRCFQAMITCVLSWPLGKETRTIPQPTCSPIWRWRPYTELSSQEGCTDSSKHCHNIAV
jgi:hypothetical protein